MEFPGLPRHRRSEAYGAPASPYRSPERAQRYYHESLSSDPRFIRPLLAMAGLRRDAGDWSGARGYLERALEVDRDSPALWRQLGFVLSMLRHWEEAREACARSIEHETDESRNALVRRRLESLGPD